MLDRFVSKINFDQSGCWLWTGHKNKAGYGKFGFNRTSVLAHRYAYQAAKGDIPNGLELDHLCRVRCCVNPKHLQAVTRMENYWRGLAPFVHITKTHCPAGHAYSGHNLYISKSGKRSCRTCQNERKRRRRAAR